MFIFGGVLGVIFILVWAYAILDVISTDSIVCRNLPKTMWLILVIMLPEIGSIAWFMLGRPASSGYTGPSLPRSTNGAPLGIEDRPDWPARAEEILKREPQPSKEDIRNAADERSRKLRDWEARLIRREKELDDQMRKKRDEEGTDTS